MGSEKVYSLYHSFTGFAPRCWDSRLVTGILLWPLISMPSGQICTGWASPHAVPMIQAPRFHSRFDPDLVVCVCAAALQCSGASREMRRWGAEFPSRDCDVRACALAARGRSLSLSLCQPERCCSCFGCRASCQRTSQCMLAGTFQGHNATHLKGRFRS